MYYNYSLAFQHKGTVGQKAEILLKSLLKSLSSRKNSTLAHKSFFINKSTGSLKKLEIDFDR